MEREDLDQIPWSNLVAQVEEGADRRWYVIGGVIALVVLAFVGIRMFGTGGGQPAPGEPAVVSQETATTTGLDELPTSQLVVAEADLKPVDDPDGSQVVTMRAEWFVTDYYTNDGSAETIASVRAALAPPLGSVDIPHEDTSDLPPTFVEWASVFDIRELPDDRFEVAVAYRSIIQTDAGFVRIPVRAVTLILEGRDEAILVASIPESIAVPGGG